MAITIVLELPAFVLLPWLSADFSSSQTSNSSREPAQLEQIRHAGNPSVSIIEPLLS